MRKLCLVLCLFIVFSALCIGSLAVQDTATVFWQDEMSYSSSGYVRFAQLADGMLIMTTDSGNLFRSSDKGDTWTKVAKRPVDSAKSTVDLSKLTVVNANGNAVAGYTSTETAHKLTRSNLQPFVLPDDTVMLAYRSNTTTFVDTYYSSIRVMKSTDGGITFGNEIILDEVASTVKTDGFWEPFMIQIDADTVALYYADDFNVDGNTTDNRQRIAYFTYSISKGEWSKEPATAIYRTSIKTRDGMPTVTALKYGGFAMVTEVHDCAAWNNSAYSSIFTIGLSLSSDGKVWTDPVAVIGPKDLTAGNLCAAPSIATLPDGRVVITFQTEMGYTGDYANTKNKEVGGTYSRVFGAAISDAPLTLSTKLTETTGGTAEGFTFLDDVFNPVENGYQIWNTVSCFGNDLYLAGTAGVVTDISGTTVTRSGHCIRLRRAEVYATASEAEVYAAAELRAGDAALAYRTLTPVGGTVTFKTPVTMAPAETIYVYEADGEYLTLMNTSVDSGDITFSASKAANYVVTDAPIVNYGDATADGNVSLMDVVRVLKRVANNDVTLDIAAADMNGDKKLDIADVIKLLVDIVN